MEAALTFLDTSQALKAELNDQGFLKGRSVVTRTGIFQYLDLNSQINNVLRHPDDVFAYDTLESMKMLPITWQHPEGGAVTTDNAKTEIIGYTGEEVIIDGNQILLNYTITDKNAIEAILNRERTELSLGYLADVEIVDGDWQGEDYSQRQRNINYNHLAVVDKANAGEAAKIVLDHKNLQTNMYIGVENMSEDQATTEKVVNDADAEKEKEMQANTNQEKDEYNGKDKEEEMNDAEGEEEPDDKTSKLEKEVETLKAERDALKEKMDSMKQKQDSAPEQLQKQINDAISEKLKVINDAKQMAPSMEVDVEAQPHEIKAAAIKNVNDVDVSDCSAVYIDAYFDIVSKNHAQSNDKAMANQRALATKIIDKKNVTDADAARQRMIENLTTKE